MQLECKYNSFGVINDEFKIGPAKWSYFDLLFVHNGQLGLWLDDNHLKLKTGQSVLIYPNTNFHGHSIVDSSHISVQHFVLKTRQGLPKEIANWYGRTKGYESFLNIPDRQVERDIERLVGIRQSCECSHVEIEMMSSLMMLILLGIHQASIHPHPNHGELFDDLRMYMENNLHRNISLNEMADICNLSKSHFRACFKKQFCQSPGEFFRNLRMKSIAIQLRETTIPIKEISRQFGFDTLPNFYRTFRTVYHTSPAEYRRSHILKG